MPPSGPVYGPGAPAPKKNPTSRIVASVLAAVLVIGGGVAAWQLWPKDKDHTTDVPTTRPTCWNPDITGDCPQFTGRDAALYVFGLRDKADETACKQNTLADSLGLEGAVGSYGCTFDDLDMAATIFQWPSADEAAKAWMTPPDQPGIPWFGFEDRWTVDGQEMGDLLARSGADDRDFHVQCYDDLPFCLLMVGKTSKIDTGEKGDWTLLRDKFDPLNAQEVGALNAFLADNPSMATPTAEPTSTEPTSTEPSTGPSAHEITDLNSVERSVVGQLAKGYCFDNSVVDLSDALNTPTIVETIPCSDPHRSQVIGFVDISDISSGEDVNSQSQYSQRCKELMSAAGVPEGLRSHARYYHPDPQEVEAGVRTVMCLVDTETPWTGSALDGTAAGY